jgi:hypothetical protein
MPQKEHNVVLQVLVELCCDVLLRKCCGYMWWRFNCMRNYKAAEIRQQAYRYCILFTFYLYIVPYLLLLYYCAITLHE